MVIYVVSLGWYHIYMHRMYLCISPTTATSSEGACTAFGRSAQRGGSVKSEGAQHPSHLSSEGACTALGRSAQRGGSVKSEGAQQHPSYLSGDGLVRGAVWIGFQVVCTLQATLRQAVTAGRRFGRRHRTQDQRARRTAASRTYKRVVLKHAAQGAAEQARPRT
jgi:hypothetical protein